MTQIRANDYCWTRRVLPMARLQDHLPVLHFAVTGIFSLQVKWDAQIIGFSVKSGHVRISLTRVPDREMLH